MFRAGRFFVLQHRESLKIIVYLVTLYLQTIFNGHLQYKTHGSWRTVYSDESRLDDKLSQRSLGGDSCSHYCIPNGIRHAMNTTRKYADQDTWK